jgi:hypothetical protein
VRGLRDQWTLFQCRLRTATDTAPPDHRTIRWLGEINNSSEADYRTLCSPRCGHTDRPNTGEIFHTELVCDSPVHIAPGTANAVVTGMSITRTLTISKTVTYAGEIGWARSSRGLDEWRAHPLRWCRELYLHQSLVTSQTCQMQGILSFLHTTTHTVNTISHGMITLKEGH